MDWIYVLGGLIIFFGLTIFIPGKNKEHDTWPADIDRFNEEEES